MTPPAPKRSRRARADSPGEPPASPPAHYFSSRSGRARPARELALTLRGRPFRFITASGTFSSRRLDRGTQLLIESLEIAPSDAVLDLGCGWGPIGIVAAALAHEGKAWLVDPNPHAVEIARRNAALNGLSNVATAQGDGTAPIGAISFDVIAMNPPIRAGKSAVFSLIEQAAACMKEGGRFYLVARTKQGARGFAQKLEQVFGNVAEVRKGSGYRVYRAQAARTREASS